MPYLRGDWHSEGTDYCDPTDGGCGKECSIILVKEGIGFYEYCGMPGYDQQMVSVSKCCHCHLTNQQE